MNVTNAVASRISGRAFLDQSVPKQTRVDILENAKHVTFDELATLRGC